MVSEAGATTASPRGSAGRPVAEPDMDGPQQERERILVCVSSHPLGGRVVRAGKRLADDLNSEWFTLYVETPAHTGMSRQQRERLQGTLRLAEELGSRVFQVPDISTAGAILRFCRQYNITRLVLGRPRRPRWYELLRGSVADQVIRQSPGISLTIITGEPSGRFNALKTDLRLRSPVWNYLLSTLLVAAASIAAALLHGSIDPSNLVMIYLAAVVLSAVFLGRGPSILASILSVLLFDFLSIDPRLSLTVADTQYLITFLGLLATGLVISNSAALLRDQVQVLRRREAETSALNSFSRELTGIFGHQAISQSIVTHVTRALPGKAIVLLPSAGNLEKAASSPGYPFTEIEAGAAGWAFEHQKQAGRDTGAWGNAAGRYLPLQAARKALGVLGVALPEEAPRLSHGQVQLLEGFASLAALAVGRANLVEQASQAQVLQNTERLQTALLNSISHELRTPLATITGALSSLAEQPAPSGQPESATGTRQELIAVATEEARRLNQIVGSLLDMSRLEAGTVRLKLEGCDAEDLVTTALARFRKQAQDLPIQVHIQPGLPAIHADFALIVQVLENLLDNAVKFSPAGSALLVEVEQHQDRVSFSVADRGRGISPSDLQKVFDKFHRGQGTARVAGIGLGLTICKGIIEAHGGSIEAQNRPGGGSVFRFNLPVQGLPAGDDHDR